LIDDFSEIDSNDGSGLDLGREVRRDVSALQERNLKTPFLDPIAGDKEYVLVLDLDETLLHFNEQTEKVFVRPHAEKFLLQMSKYYEIVIFTAGMQDYADWALTHLRGNVAQKCISHRLYRNHAIPCREIYIKDLSFLGRDLNKTIIVDNIAENFLLQPENGISIKSWYNDPEDTALVELTPLLMQMVQAKVPDVRVALRESKEQMLRLIADGEQKPTSKLSNLSFCQSIVDK